MGVPPAENLQDRIIYTVAGADAVVVSTTNALDAHVISSKDAEYVSTSAKGLSGLATAASQDTDPKSAEARLKLAESILRDLKAYLTARGAK